MSAANLLLLFYIGLFAFIAALPIFLIIYLIRRNVSYEQWNDGYSLNSTKRDVFRDISERTKRRLLVALVGLFATAVLLINALGSHFLVLALIACGVHVILTLMYWRAYIKDKRYAWYFSTKGD